MAVVMVVMALAVAVAAMEEAAAAAVAAAVAGNTGAVRWSAVPWKEAKHALPWSKDKGRLIYWLVGWLIGCVG